MHHSIQQALKRIPFLLSVIESGEQLSQDSHNEIMNEYKEARAIMVNSERIERFIILEKEKSFEAMRVCGTKEQINRQAREAYESGLYESVIITKRSAK